MKRVIFAIVLIALSTLVFSQSDSMNIGASVSIIKNVNATVTKAAKKFI